MKTVIAIAILACALGCASTKPCNVLLDGRCEIGSAGTATVFDKNETRSPIKAWPGCVPEELT